jgi:hypothetical protein
LFQDVAQSLSSIANAHEDDGHLFWKNQTTLLGQQKIGDLEFLCAAAGSDYELPTVFVIYLDMDGGIRGYVPQRGNSFDVSDFTDENVSDFYNWDLIKEDILEFLTKP